MKNLTVVIVTLKSDHVIDHCIKSIDKSVKILIVENSNNFDFKKKIEKKYKNVSCILSGSNIGMGAANNIGINKAKSDFVLIMNPDVILFKHTIVRLFRAIKKIKDFTIISPLSSNLKYPNYSTKKKNLNFKQIFEVDSLDGYCMLMNKKKIMKFSKNKKIFDENFFMYLENDDLCKRIKNRNEKIYIVPSCKIKHLGAQAVSKNLYREVELSRNWHWSWSKFYFSKKYHGYIYSLLKVLPKFLSSLIKGIFYLLIFKEFESKIYFNRAFGFFNGILGKPSWYRPKLDLD